MPVQHAMIWPAGSCGQSDVISCLTIVANGLFSHGNSDIRDMAMFGPYNMLLNLEINWH
jgi:hypothetical protein